LEPIIDEYLEKYDKLVLKSTNQRGSRSVYFIDRKKNILDSFKKKISFKELISRQRKEYFPLIIMEEFVKPVYDIDILTWKGKLLKIVQRKRIHSDFPNMGHEIVNIKSINQYCKNIVDKLEISWLYDCDIMFNKKNQPCLLEINPRQSGSLAISMMYGVNFIDDIIKLSHGENISKIKKTQNKIFVPYKTLKCLSSDV
jgi:biotin carboxylase